MRKLPWAAILLLAGSSPSPAQDQAAVTAALAKLKPEIAPETQLEALNQIAISLDPRIPAACFPMLHSPGHSVQRNAARAIGSRWWQISADHQPPYVKELKSLFDCEDDAVQRMARRGVGLLTRKYEGEMFSRSKDKRWVIYERHGKPCLIDTGTSSEELLGSERDGTFAPAYSNDPVAPACHWHPKEAIVAMDVYNGRRVSEVWVWQHGSGLMAIGPQLILPLIKSRGEVHGLSGIYIQFDKWEGLSLKVKTDYTIRNGDDFVEHTAVFQWDPDGKPLRLISDLATVSG